jgi:catechol 2,3-dioxygenase-like lactoylglutathione lyase family enzyme
MDVGRASVRGRVPRSLHHAALCVRDLDASLRFYRDGLGLEVLMDERFDGDWPALFGARTRVLHSVFLGEPSAPNAGIVELVEFDGGVDDRSEPDRPARGFFLLSFFVDLDATLSRLARLGLGGRPRRIEQPGGHGTVGMATVHDPDLVRVELIESGPARI